MVVGRGAHGTRLVREIHSDHARRLQYDDAPLPARAARGSCAAATGLRGRCARRLICSPLGACLGACPSHSAGRRRDNWASISLMSGMTKGADTVASVHVTTSFYNDSSGAGPATAGQCLMICPCGWRTERQNVNHPGGQAGNNLPLQSLEPRRFRLSCSRSTGNGLEASNCRETAEASACRSPVQ